MSDVAETGIRTEPPKVKYEFQDIGSQLTDVLIRAAEDQVTEAQNLLASTKALAEDINAQIKEHSALIEDVNGRLKMFGESVVEAHKKFLNGKE
jgi:uncharacterized protein YoxC